MMLKDPTKMNDWLLTPSLPGRNTPINWQPYWIFYEILKLTT